MEGIKIRDFYDLGVLLQKYPQHFSKESLFSIYEKISYAGVDELNLLLIDEISAHNLTSLENINIDNYAQNMLKNIDEIMENIQQESQEDSKDENLNNNKNIRRMR